jgi:hypothetical protein
MNKLIYILFGISDFTNIDLACLLTYLSLIIYIIFK